MIPSTYTKLYYLHPLVELATFAARIDQADDVLLPHVRDAACLEESRDIGSGPRHDIRLSA